MSTNRQTHNVKAPSSSKRNGNSPLWKKLFSSNWWWYGQVNPDPKTLPPPEKRPKLWRAYMWPWVVLWVLFLFAPTASSLLNYDKPQKQEMQTLYGEVIATSARSPHVQIRLANGEVIDAEFPVQVTYIRGVKTELFKETVHKLVLTCKQVVVSGTYLRFMPFKRFRMWDFSCVNGAFFVPESEIQKKWIRGRLTTHTYISAIQVLAFIFIVFCYFYRERKDYVLKN